MLRGITVLWHELGHAVWALALTRAPVEVRLDRPDPGRWRAGRLSFDLALRAGRGRTFYDPTDLSRIARSAIALGGPLASVLGLGLGLWLGLRSEAPFAVRFFGFVWAWSHLRVLVFTFAPVFPRKPEADPARGTDWADLRQIWSR